MFCYFVLMQRRFFATVLLGCACVVTAVSQGFNPDSLKAALVLAKADSNKVDLLNDLSRAVYLQGNLGEGEKYAKDARALSESLDFKRGLGQALNNLGTIAYFKGSLAEALAWYKESLNIRNSIGDQKGIGSSYINIGNIYKEQSNYPKALEYYFASLKVREAIGDKAGVAASRNNIGSVYDKLKENDKALENYLKALEVGAGDPTFTAGLMNNIANIYYNQLHIDKAIEYYNRSVELCEKADYKKGMGMALSNLGNTYDTKEEYDKAMQHYVRALQIAEEIGDKPGLPALLTNMGNNFRCRKKFAEALSYGLRALTIARETGSGDEVSRGSLALSQTCQAMGRDQEALQYYKAHIAARDSLYNEENTRQNVRIEMNYEFEKKEAVARAAQEKKEAVAAAEARRQRIILFSISGFGMLVLVFAVFAYRSFLQKKKANIEISRQKLVIEQKQKEILDSIHYAKRIQHSLMPSEKNVQKLLNRRQA